MALARLFFSIDVLEAALFRPHPLRALSDPSSAIDPSESF
jgi:hypothetical protein